MVDYFASTGTNSALDDILNQPFLREDTQDLAWRVQSLEDKVREAGHDPGLTEPRQSFFMSLLDTLDAPRQGLAGIADTLMRGDFGEEDVGTGFRRGQKENVTTADILRRHDIIDNPILRGIVGFAGDVITDPLNLLTFGAPAAAAKVGKYGSALNEAGMKVLQDTTASMASKGLDLFDLQASLDKGFDAVKDYQQAKKWFDTASDPAVRESYAAIMDRSLAYMPEEFKALDLTQKLFEPKKLQIGTGLPFIGHFQEKTAKAAKELVLNDVGPIGGALRAFGDVLNPGTLKLAEIPISDEVIEAASKVKNYATDLVSNAYSALAPLDNVPLIGAVKKGGEAVGSLAMEAATWTNKTIQKIFNEKAIIGPGAHTFKLDFVNARAAAEEAGLRRAFDNLGPDLLQNPALQKEVMLAIDAQAATSFSKVDDYIKAYKAQNAGALPPGALEVQDIMDKMNRGVPLSQGEELTLYQNFAQFDADRPFREGLDNLINSPDVAPEVKGGIQQVTKLLDELQAEERLAGLDVGFIDSYVPHRYEQISKSTDFSRLRKYETFGDAFTQSGKYGDYNLGDVLARRIQRSYTMRAEKAYATRMMMEEGLDPKIVTQLYKQALIQGPESEAALALKRMRIPLGSFDVDKFKQAYIDSKRQVAYQGAGALDPNMSKVVAQSAQDFSEELHKNLWLSGAKPLDNIIPDAAIGEIGKEITNIDGTKFWLPTTLANAYEETIAGKDILKQMASSSPIASKLLEVIDGATAWFKKAVTTPFPAYWSVNFFGDRFQQAMQGIHANNPNLIARAHSVMSGKSSIMSPTGQVLTPQMLKRAMKEMGLNYSTTEYLQTVDAAGKANIQKYLDTKNPMWKNIKKAAKGDRSLAMIDTTLDQAQQRLRTGFDGMFRVAHMIHRFEQGDTLSNAARAANEVYFNYRDLSSVEQSFFRRFFFFYDFMSKATKRSLTQLFTRPANLTFQQKGINAAAEMFSDPNAPPTADEWDAQLLQSTATREMFGRVIGRSPDGNPIVGRFNGAPLSAVMQQFSVQMPRNFTVGELVSTAADSVHRTVQKQFASANPVINSAAQLISGKNLYFDKPLDADFLRKLPSLNAAAERIAGYKHDELPIDLDIIAKEFLGAKPDGKGRLVADPAKMWILTNLIPGMGRFISTAGSFTNTDIPTGVGLTRFLAGVNLDDADPSRGYLYDRKNQLEALIRSKSIGKYEDQ